MVKEIDRAGIPVDHVCTVVPISLTIGANRIVPAGGIPHPLGDPRLGEPKSTQIRYEIVEKALETLTVPVDKQTVFNWD